MRMLRMSGRMEMTASCLQCTFVGVCADFLGEVDSVVVSEVEAFSLGKWLQRFADGDEVWTGFADEDFEDGCE